VKQSNGTRKRAPRDLGPRYLREGRTISRYGVGTSTPCTAIISIVGHGHGWYHAVKNSNPMTWPWRSRSRQDFCFCTRYIQSKSVILHNCCSVPPFYVFYPNMVLMIAAALHIYLFVLFPSCPLHGKTSESVSVSACPVLSLYHIKFRINLRWKKYPLSVQPRTVSK
jgi:hypothetical protein